MLPSEFLNLLKKTDPEKLKKVKGLGEVLVSNLTEFLNSERFESLNAGFLELEKLNLAPEIVSNKSLKTGKLSGKRICITGSFDISREEIKILLENLGAKVVSTVSKNTDYLLMGQSGGSKVEAAKKLKIQIINDYKEFLN